MRLINADETLNDIFERHCKECVSRKGVKNGKLRVLYDIGDAPCRACLIDDMKTMIEDAPTVEAEPVRHGKYIGTEFDGYADGCPVYYEWMCSECGCVFEGEEPTYNYCPSCGARMDGENENWKKAKV